MELYDVMRTTFAARQFTSDPVSDQTLYKVVDAARFAPSGGNRQGWKVVVVRDAATEGARRAERARGEAVLRPAAGRREPVERHRPDHRVRRDRATPAPRG